MTAHATDTVTAAELDGFLALVAQPEPFRHARRGYDPGQVHDALNAAADLIRRLCDDAVARHTHATALIENAEAQLADLIAQRDLDPDPDLSVNAARVTVSGDPDPLGQPSSERPTPATAALGVGA